MSRPNKYVCIHGHFYQPPRENAWLETVEQQETSRPFHDWNERINFECYAPNAAARILDEQGWITKIRNNYNRISFNFGPTLLTWLAEHDAVSGAALQNLSAAQLTDALGFAARAAAITCSRRGADLPRRAELN